MHKNSRSLSSGCLAKLVAGLGLVALAGFAHAANEGLAGIWRIEKPIFAVRTIEGKEPPLKPEAAKLYAKRQAARKAGDTSFDSATWCASVGMPRILFIDHPFEIVVRGPYVVFAHEWNWWARVVYLDGALDASASAGPAGGPPGFGPGGGPGGPPGGGSPPGFGPPGGGPPPGFSPPAPGKEAPGPMGLSKGKWEGDTLVVETGRLSHLTLIDSAGMPHSDDFKLTERIRLRSPDVLENRIRIEDPGVFTQPWETMVTYKRQRDATIEEDVCLDRIKTGAPAVKE